jgi:hypothetical protein
MHKTGKARDSHGYTPACFRHTATVLYGMLKDSPNGKITVSFTDREPCPISNGCVNEAVFKVVIPKTRKKSSKPKRLIRFCDQCGAYLL